MGFANAWFTDEHAYFARRNPVLEDPSDLFLFDLGDRGGLIKIGFVIVSARRLNGQVRLLI